MKAYRHLVKHALDSGFCVSVFDGEIWEVRRSTKLKEITDCIESVEEAQLRFSNIDGMQGWALVSAYGLCDDETVINFGCNDFMNAWESAYQKQYAL